MLKGGRQLTEAYPSRRGSQAQGTGSQLGRSPVERLTHLTLLCEVDKSSRNDKHAV